MTNFLMFKQRARFDLKEATKFLHEPSSMIRHLLINKDGTYSIMSHIVCDYCDTQGDCRGVERPVAVPAKQDPYEVEGR